MIQSLSKLKEKESGIIQSIDQNHLQAEHIVVLMDHGFIPGNKIEVISYYLFHEKIIVQIGNSELAVKYQDAKHIYIEV